MSADLEQQIVNEFQEMGCFEQAEITQAELDIEGVKSEITVYCASGRVYKYTIYGSGLEPSSWEKVIKEYFSPLLTN